MLFPKLKILALSKKKVKKSLGLKEPTEGIILSIPRVTSLLLEDSADLRGRNQKAGMIN